MLRMGQRIGLEDKGFIPNITGNSGIGGFRWGSADTSFCSEAFALGTKIFGVSSGGSALLAIGGTFNASHSSSVYTDVDRVFPASLSVLMVIKY